MHQQFNIIELSTHKLNRWFAWPAFPCLQTCKKTLNALILATEANYQAEIASKLPHNSRPQQSMAVDPPESMPARTSGTSTWRTHATFRPSPAVLPTQRRLLQHWPDLLISLSMSLSLSFHRSIQHSCTGIIVFCFVGFWFVSCNANAHPAQPCQRERPQKSVNKTWQVWTNWRVRKGGVCSAGTSLLLNSEARSTDWSLPDSVTLTFCLKRVFTASCSCLLHRMCTSRKGVSFGLRAGHWA